MEPMQITQEARDYNQPSQTQIVSDSYSDEFMEMNVTPNTTKPWCRLVSLNSAVQVKELFHDDSLKNEDNIKGLNILGRAERCNFQFESKKISSEHCRIFYLEHTTEQNQIYVEVYIEDISANGTWINRHARLSKHTRRMLHNGDIISLINPGPGPSYSDDVEKLSFTVCIMMPTREDLLASRSNKKQYHLLPDESIQPSTVVDQNGVLKSVTVNRLLRQSRNVHDYYEQKGELGRGGNGQVIKAVNRMTGKEVAVKVIDTRHCFYHAGEDLAAGTGGGATGETAELDKLLQEAHMLRSLKHPRITALEDIFADGHNLYIVMELLYGGDLFERVMKKKRYPEHQAKVLLGQLVDGIYYLHSRKIAHRDLKIENIMLVSADNDVDIKITDFGLAKSMDETGGLKTFCGTPQYFAPEVLAKSDASNKSTYNLESDMWSVGTIAFVLLSGRMPWATNDAKKMYNQIANGKFSFAGAEWRAISEDAKSFISKLLVVNPLLRMTAKDAMKHEWLRSEFDIKSSPQDCPSNSSVQSHLDDDDESSTSSARVPVGNDALGAIPTAMSIVDDTSAKAVIQSGVAFSAIGVKTTRSSSRSKPPPLPSPLPPSSIVSTSPSSSSLAPVTVTVTGRRKRAPTCKAPTPMDQIVEEGEGEVEQEDVHGMDVVMGGGEGGGDSKADTMPKTRSRGGDKRRRC